MATNSFGNIFKITTWGESHGKSIGVVIDGCPAGLDLSEEDINAELSLRMMGKSSYTSTRKEKDEAEILSGTFEGQTTGSPISIIIYNRDADSSKYEPIKHIHRPGHANFTYLHKYGVFDYRGGGRSSARETACRVAAGAVAKKLLSRLNIKIVAYIKAIGNISISSLHTQDIDSIKQAVLQSPIYCPDLKASEKMMQEIENVQKEGDTLGGIIEAIAYPIPIGLGDPVYEKLEANLAKAMLSLPATKGFEIGSGFKSSSMRGSEHNDLFTQGDLNTIVTKTNHSGGTLGGISNGMPLILRVAFKPTSSIMKIQQTTTIQGENVAFQLPQGSRHDPCVTIRAVPIVESMAAIVLVDAVLLNRCSKI